MLSLTVSAVFVGTPALSAQRSALFVAPQPKGLGLNSGTNVPLLRPLWGLNSSTERSALFVALPEGSRGGA